MVSSSDLGDRPQWSSEFPILLTTPRFPRGTGTNGLLVTSPRAFISESAVPAFGSWMGFKLAWSFLEFLALTFSPCPHPSLPTADLGPDSPPAQARGSASGQSRNSV
jgi:hypothetical protein